MNDTTNEERLTKLLRQARRGVDYYCNLTIPTTVTLLIEAEGTEWIVKPVVDHPLSGLYGIYGRRERLDDAVQDFRNNVRAYVVSAINSDQLICFGNE